MKVVGRIILSTLSVLGISFAVWVIVLLNPNTLYAEKTVIGQVSVYHDTDLANEAETIIQDAITIAASSSLYDQRIAIDLCLNDGGIYARLHPLARGTAYAFLNKTVLHRCQVDFSQNVAAFSWEINHGETRYFNLTYLLAHEFVHNLQYHIDPFLDRKVPFWKLEGHAEYIARRWKNDGQWYQRVDQWQKENQKEHSGVPIIYLADGTVQNLSYLQYSLAIQYMMEVEKQTFADICTDKRSLAEVYDQALTAWHSRQ